MVCSSFTVGNRFSNNEDFYEQPTKNFPEDLTKSKFRLKKGDDQLQKHIRMVCHPSHIRKQLYYLLRSWPELPQEKFCSPLLGEF